MIVAASLMIISDVCSASATHNSPLKKARVTGVDQSEAMAPERLSENAEPVKSAVSPFTSAQPRIFNRSFSLPAGSLAIQRTVSQSMPVYGNVIHSDKWSSYNKKYNISSLPTDGSSTKFTQIAQEYYMNGNGGSVYADGKYYIISFQQYGSTRFPTIYVYNAETWEYEKEIDIDASSISTDMAYDSTTGKIYGCFYGDDSSERRFGTIDMSTGKVTQIKALDVNWNAIAINAQGVVYAIDNNGDLFTVDKTDGAMTKVGNTGLKPYYVSSAAFDQRTGRLYYSYSPEDASGSLWEINTVTAAATKLYDYENREEVVGMWVPLPLAEDEAPAALTSITPEFIKGSLSGTVTFTAPTVSFVGDQPLTGELTYTVTMNGEQAATGTTTPGAVTVANVTVPTAGIYEIKVTTANSFGPSPVIKTSLWIGNDTPKAVKNVKLDYVDGNFNLTWDPATDSNNGGYINPDEVTYTVTRYPDETVVAAALKGITTFSEPMTVPENLTSYYYTVAAEFNGGATKPVASNRYTLGNIIPPYSQDFNDPLDVNTFTIINADGDTRTWEANNGMVRSRYNTKADTHNWLITPAVKMKGGTQYEFSFDAKANSLKYTSFMEVWFGTAPTVEGMTTQLLERTEVKLRDMTHYSVKINVDTDGLYYFAIHDCSNTNGDALFVDDMAISAGMSTALPTAPSNVKATPDYNGKLNMTISCTLPTLTIADKNLTKLTKAELSRDGEVIYTMESPAPGAELNYTDTDSRLTQGRHTYIVAAYTEAGRGVEVTVTPYVGINMPTEPQNVNLVETSRSGEVTMTWKAPETDVDGNPLNPAFVSYLIMGVENGEAKVMARDIKDNTWTYQAIPADAAEQDFVFYGIAAETEGGISDPVVSPIIAVGPAYKLPIAESFADTKMSLKWAENIVSGNGAWQLMDENTFSTMGSQDGDNGYVCYRAKSQKEVAQLLSGKIAISGQNPTLSFWYHPLSGSTNVINTKVVANGTETTVNSTVISSGSGVWDKVLVDLSAYVGQTVQIAMEVEALLHLNTSLDNFSLYNRADYDVAPVAINVPAEFSVGTPGKITVDVENTGAKAAENFAVALYLNGRKVDSKNVESLAPAAVTTVEFEQNLDVMTPEQLSYYAVTEYAADENQANNTSATVESTLIMPRLAWVTDLAASASNGAINLTWSAPDANALYSKPETDDFESYETYLIDNVGKWTMIDKDQSITFGVQDVDYPNSTKPAAYMVFGDKEKFPHESMKAHSGEKFLACFGATSKQNDDWLVSPRLNGKAQTISFYAKTYDIKYGNEKFELMYTASATIDTEQFVKLADSDNVPGAWTKYEYELPAGTQYFAIRCTSQDCYIFMVDDVTYTAAVVDDAVLTGYNIYRNGVKINSEPVKETSYSDSSAETNPVYVVTAVYTEGESRPSNAVTLTTTGIESVDSQASVTITVRGHNITVNNADELAVSVYAADGRTIHQGQGSATVTVPATGVYVVKAGEKVAKVAVR